MVETFPNRVPHRPLILALIPSASLAFYLSLTPFAGDPCYHCFADARPALGVPNFADVLSNLPFLIVGIFGLKHWKAHRPSDGRYSWLVFHLGVIGVAIGSAYYHWNPNDATLVWDRLPMTLAFIGLSLAMMAELVHPAFDRHPLMPALLIGTGSVIYWYTMQDLRPYLWVQTLPLLVVPTTTAVFPKRFTHRRYLIFAVAFYLGAKMAERHDSNVFEILGGSISGHTIKHLLAAGGCAMIVIMLYRRKGVAER